MPAVFEQLTEESHVPVLLTVRLRTGDSQDEASEESALESTKLSFILATGRVHDVGVATPNEVDRHARLRRL